MAVRVPTFQAPANLRYVDAGYAGVSTGSQSQPYATIAAAIAAAAAGDTIYVAPGVYVEDLVWAAGEDINLVSSDPGAVAIQGAMEITDATVRLVGLVIEDDGVAGTDAIHFTGVAADTLTIIGCDVGATAAGLAAISADNTAGTVVIIDSTVRSNVGNANQVIQLESGSLDCRSCDILHGNNAAEAFVAEGDAASAAILFHDCRFVGSVNAEAAVVAPTAMACENCNFTVGAISAVIIAATCTVVVDGGTITSTDAGNDAIDGAGTLTLGAYPVFASTADEIATTLTVAHLLGSKIQHGDYTEAAGAGTRAIVLPQVFPTANYNVFVSYQDTGAGAQASSNEVDTLATTGFNLTTQLNGIYHWLAVHD